MVVGDRLLSCSGLLVTKLAYVLDCDSKSFALLDDDKIPFSACAHPLIDKIK